MNDLRHLQAAMANASQFVQSTWQQVAVGATAVPGVPPIKVNIGLRRAYAEAVVLAEQLNLPNIGFFRHLVVATHKASRDLEYGRGPWDMKPGLLNGPKARISKRGKKYLLVPFRHRTPQGATPDQNFSGVMPKDIYQAAKMLKGKERLTGTEQKYPPKTNQFTKPGGMAAAYKHKAGIYENMTKVGEKGQSQYMTFRAVSENSDPDSWWHPGNDPFHIAAGVRNYCLPIVEKGLRSAAIADVTDISGLSVGMTIVRGF